MDRPKGRNGVRYRPIWIGGPDFDQILNLSRIREIMCIEDKQFSRLLSLPDEPIYPKEPKEVAQTDVKPTQDSSGQQ